MSSALRLLIVDDSNVIRSRIARVVNDPRMPLLQIVGLAKDGLEAVKVFEQTKPHLVTMDLTMPKLDGLQCIEQLIRLNHKTNILVVSALNDKITAIQALKKGARGFLHKPFSDQQLINAFNELVSI